MAFRKTSVAVEPPTPVDLPAPAVGEIRDDGKVWDGGSGSHRMSGKHEKWTKAQPK